MATRIALSPAKESVYGTRLDELFIDAVPLRYRRIVDGPGYSLSSALRAAAVTRREYFFRA